MKEQRNRFTAAELEDLYPPDPEPRGEALAIPPSVLATLAVITGANCAAFVTCVVILPRGVVMAAGGTCLLTWLAIYAALRKWSAR